MSRHPVKDEVSSHNGHIPLGRHLVEGAGMPGQSKVYPVKAACPGHKLFGPRSFLCRATKEHHLAAAPLLHEAVPDCHSCCKASGPQQIVTAAMARPAGRHRLLHRTGRPLTQAIQGVKLRQQSHRRLSAPAGKGGDKTGGNPGYRSLHRKSLPLQRLTQGAGGLFFTIGSSA